VCGQGILRFKCRVVYWKNATVEIGRIKFENNRGNNERSLKKIR
jgi:hypothetical protein